jgi:hypothetical protein
MLCWPVQMTDGKRIQNFGGLNILESSRLKHQVLKNSEVVVHLDLHCSFCQDKMYPTTPLFPADPYIVLTSKQYACWSFLVLSNFNKFLTVKAICKKFHYFLHPLFL